jgi:hypothetical protein
MEMEPPQKQEEPRSNCGLQSARSAVQHRRSIRPGAIRMARLRQRRERGFRVYQVEVCAADLAALIERGLLDRLQRADANAVECAIGRLLDRLSG